MTRATPVIAPPYLRLLGTFVQRYGVSVEDWLERSGACASAFHADDFAPDVVAVSRLVREAVAATGETALGLVFGAELGLQAHGALGYAATSSRSLRAVLDVLERYARLRFDVLEITVDAGPDEVRVRYAVAPYDGLLDILLEALVAATKVALDDLSLGACPVVRAAFPFSAPPHAARAPHLLGCPVRYGQPWAGLALSPDALDRPLKMSDPRAFERAEALCREQMDELAAHRSWSSRTRRVLLERRHGFPSLSETARRLRVSPRTLHRRLAEEGTAFRVILEEVSRRLAMEHLARSEAGIDEVAYLLGYADPSNFRRAFRRWTGESASGYRARLKKP